MLADRLNGSLVKVTGVAEEGPSNVVCVLQASVELIEEWLLRPLLELTLDALLVGVDSVNPVVVCDGELVGHMVLEHDHVAVRDLNGILRGEDWGGVGL